MAKKAAAVNKSKSKVVLPQPEVKKAKPIFVEGDKTMPVWCDLAPNAKITNWTPTRRIPGRTLPTAGRCNTIKLMTSAPFPFGRTLPITPNLVELEKIAERKRKHEEKMEELRLLALIPPKKGKKKKGKKPRVEQGADDKDKKNQANAAKVANK